MGGRAGLRSSGTRPCDSVPRGVTVSWHLPLDFATKRCAPPFPSPRSPSFRLDTSKAAAAVPRRGASRRAVGMGRRPPSKPRGRGSAGRGKRMSLDGVCVRSVGELGGARSGGPPHRCAPSRAKEYTPPPPPSTLPSSSLLFVSTLLGGDRGDGGGGGVYCWAPQGGAPWKFLILGGPWDPLVGFFTAFGGGIWGHWSPKEI